MKKKKNVMYRKSVSLLAATAMTAVLMTGQIYPVAAWGQNTETRLEKSSLIPDNITIDQPVALSEVTLPKSDYGTLSWADDSYIPDKRVQTCEVVFKPAADVDLSYISGWDSEKKVVKGKITVVVSSIEESSEDQPSDTAADVETGDESSEASVPDGTTSDNKDTDIKSDDAAVTGENQQNDSETSGKTEDQTENAGNKQNSEADKKEETTESTPASDEAKSEDSTEAADEITAPAEKTEAAAPAVEETADSEDIQEKAAEESKTDTSLDTAAEESKADISSDTAADSIESTNSDNSEAAASDNVQTADSSEDTGKLNETFGAVMPGATILDGTGNSVKNENTEEKKDTADTTNTTEVKDTTDPIEDDQKNIFDNPLDFTTADTRPATAEDDLTEEEQAARAAQNHSCEGISVSGIDLPWYVQFQVTSGENYEFKNEDKATIFQSYEFKLWDLKNNTEYEIPDGQYVSVTIPVKEGYKYSIEHLLDNGATETIIPSVNGSTMVFSTHSFSPFGIAGFRPIVGEDIANGAYGDGSTPTPTPTVTISGTPTPSPSVTGTGTNGTNESGTGKTDSNSGNETGGNTGDSNGNSNGNTNGSSNGTSGTETGGSSSGTGSSDDSDNSGTSNTPGAASDGTVNSGTTDGSSSNGTGSSTNAGQTAGNTTGNTANISNGNNGQSQTSNAVKTGDNTMILPFVILVIAAAAVIIIVIVVRKKKR
ncbi:hypothetical protein RO865_23120 [Blautia faecis]|uniref:hypothetical protein n=1 Tax=Blautia faecis TaxID=871665 RepID=UPI00157108D0|nr:hypothetical protein [Blautia faecis]MDT4371617.1 hypothetical protein [Blautia faecis]NSG91297.1 hypothetical protein [Blautia faecis]